MKRFKGFVLGLGMLVMLAGCGKEEAVTGTTSNASGDVTEASTGEKTSEPATVEKEEVVTEGMVPVSGEELLDGDYAISVRSSSSMFVIEACTLTVKDGAMTAKMVMSGKGYTYVYPGTKEEAEAAAEKGFDTCVAYVEEADGAYSFTIPVTELNAAVPCAAFSKKKEAWYGRDLCFEAAGLPVEAYKELPYKTVEALGLSDGDYTVKVTLAGGSGKASVESPAKLRVKDGKAYATIVWSSKKYDFMMVDGVRYDMINEEGENSAFEIPVKGFDYAMPVQADTTAMSEAHLIDYTLTFDGSDLLQ